MKQTIHLEKGKQLTITTDSETYGTYTYRTQPGEAVQSLKTLNTNDEKVIAPEDFNRQFEIETNKRVTLEISNTRLQLYTKVAKKYYTEDGDIDPSFGISVLVADSAYLNMLLPEPTDSDLEGRILNVMTGSLHAHDVRIAGSGHKFHLGATTPFDALDFNDKYGANVTLTVCDGRWVIVESSNVSPYND